MLFIEGTQNDGSGSVNPDGRGYFRVGCDAALASTVSYARPGMRHSKLANVTHLDGHVQSWKLPNEARTYLNFPFNQESEEAISYIRWK